jgi:ammonia channel protein AmtB
VRPFHAASLPWFAVVAPVVSSDCVVVAVFGFVMAYVWFKISDKITPLRVSAETELAGLDIPEMGVKGYPEFVLAEKTAAE